jgi:hypothetical protein
MSQVIDRAKEEDDVEFSESCGIHVVDAHAYPLAAILVVPKRRSAKIEIRPLGAIAFLQRAQVIGKVIDGDDLSGAAA